MKEKIIINVPDYVEKISDWLCFDSMLPQGKVIINKVLCGCGMTHYFLSDKYTKPIILAAPRKVLINNKLNDSLLTGLHYFDRENIPDVSDSVKQLKKYLQPYLFNPKESPFNPKIVVTFDSLHYVVETIQKLGFMDDFTIVIDEFTCIFTDAKLKGLTEISLLKLLNSLPNQCIYVSATPINEIYLQESEEFKDTYYYELKWDPRRFMKVSFKIFKMKSPHTSICRIIEDYRKKGYFRYDDRHGTRKISKEAVFFINSVADIVKVIKKMGLTPADTRIIWSNGKKNEEALKKINEQLKCSVKFDNGYFPSRETYQQENKTFTFVTRTAFEGADLYSDNASIYVFGDPNKENLGLDISLDMVQIVGRCRTEENPFRDLIYCYYKTTQNDRFDKEEAIKLIERRRAESDEIRNTYYGKEIPDWLLRKLSNAQKEEGYSDDYIDIYVDGSGKKELIFNELVYLADLRILEIKEFQYKNNESVYLYLLRNGFEYIPLTPGNSISTENDFMVHYNSTPVFEDRLKWCFESLAEIPGLIDFVKLCPEIPGIFKRYLFELGPDLCRSKGFKEIALKRELDFQDNHNLISKELSNLLQPGIPYPKKQVKDIIQNVYNKLNIVRKAKGTDLLLFFPNVDDSANYIDANHKPQKGFKISL